MREQFARPVLLVAILATLSACSSQPQLPQFEDVPTVDNWQAKLPEQVATNIQTEQAVEDMSQWWQQWQDSTLNQLLEQVLANNPNLESAGISHQIALVQAGVATGAYRPKGSLGLGQTIAMPRICRQPTLTVPAPMPLGN